MLEIFGETVDGDGGVPICEGRFRLLVIFEAMTDLA
jgi:hypothetical protein